MADRAKPVPMKVGANTMSFMWKTPRERRWRRSRGNATALERVRSAPQFDRSGSSPKRSPLRASARAGLTVETINLPSLDQNLASASTEMRDYTVRLFERLIAIAETIGATGVIVVTGRVNPLIPPARPDLEGWFADAFERVLRAAERTGVHLLLENIPMGVYPRADQLIGFAEHIGSPLVGVCYDIANAHFIGEDTAEGLGQVQPRLGIVHLSDTGRQTWRHDPVGQGSCDFAAFGAKLREIGYSRTSMLEIVSEQPIEGIVASHRKIAQLGWAALPA